MKKPKIVGTGMSNTKGAEIKFLAQQVAEQGGEPVIMDISLGAAVDWAEISLEQVLASTATIGDMLYGKWRKGMYRGAAGVIA